MKSIITLLLLCISIPVLAQSTPATHNKFQKEYNALEFKIKTDTDSLTHVISQKMNKLSYDVKTELNDLQAKYGSSNVKLALYQKKYERKTLQIKTKYELRIAKIQGEHQAAMSKIQLKFQTEISRLKLKYKIANN